MAMVVPLSANEKASRALMATEVAPMDAQATSVSSDSPQKLLENAVETIGDAVGSPLSGRAKEGDNALETLVDVAAAAAGERPEGTAELLKQEPSSLATNEEGEEKMSYCVLDCVCVWVAWCREEAAPLTSAGSA